MNRRERQWDFMFNALSAFLFFVATCLIGGSIVCLVAILFEASLDWSIALLLLLAGCALCELSLAMAKAGQPMLSSLQAIAVVLAAAPAEASPSEYFPFGLAAERRPSEFDCQSLVAGNPDHTGQYACVDLPDPDPLFEQYIVAYVSGVGICNVVAASPHIEDNEEGAVTRKVYGNATRKMESQFGPPDERVDHSRGPVGSEDALFREGIIGQDREIFEQWNDLSRKYKNLDSASLTIAGGRILWTRRLQHLPVCR